MKIGFDSSKFETLDEYHELRQQYSENVQNLKRNWTRIEDAIITRASSLLPSKEFQVEFKISIDISVEENDESIAIHPVYTSETEAFVSKASHKVHSILCRKLLKYDVDAIPEEDKALVRTLETIQLEGVGDHIDKEYFVYSENHSYPDYKFESEFKATLDNIYQTITAFDEVFRNMAQETTKSKKSLEDLKVFTPSYGNPLGYYMSTIIIKNSLLNELLTNLNNPFNFFRLYNKAVSKDRVEIPSFSEETINQIIKLEELYLKKDSN